MDFDDTSAARASHAEDYHSMACLANAIIFALACLALATLLYFII